MDTNVTAKHLLFAALAGMALAAASAASAQQPITLRIGHNTPVGTPTDIGVKRFAQVVGKYYGGAQITVEGFADPAGSTRYNLGLSKRRADAVREYLVSKGMSDAQLRTIGKLLKSARSVIHAGDPDDEGQLIVDEILQWAGSRLPVQRLLINDNNLKVVQRALASMRDNREFAGLSASAEARSVGDLLYGVNMTRAYTLAAQARGFQGVLSVGRVQTPILGLVVRRDRDFEAHTKSYYYTVSGQFSFAGLTFPARYQIGEGDPVDEQRRLIDRNFATSVAGAVQGQPARIAAGSCGAWLGALGIVLSGCGAQLDGHDRGHDQRGAGPARGRQPLAL